MTDRDERLARTFLDAADTLGAPFDLLEFLSGLARSCVDLFETVEAAVTGRRRVGLQGGGVVLPRG